MVKKLVLFLTLFIIMGGCTTMTMQLTSSEFEHQGNIPSKYTCDGANINPPLTITNIPENTKSLVLLMDDPDVPKNIREDGMWDHWVVFNIPPTTKTIFEGQEPPGIQGLNTGGVNGYGGPCPPDREHRYFFKLYALDIELDLSLSATKTEVEQAMQGHVLEKTELVGRYKRG